MARGGFQGVGARGGVAADRMLRHAADLKLTDEQIGKLERISSNTKKTLIDLHAEIEKGEIDIQNLLRSGTDDMTRIKRQLEAVSKARVGIEEARIAAFFEARDVLTDEQKKMVKDEFPRLGRILD
jgi:Spy/CpxP family protein refolding chaperone